MDLEKTLVLIGLGAALGVAGQLLRTFSGSLKARAEAKKEKKSSWWDWGKFLVGLCIGGVAGILAAISQYEPEVKITKNLCWAFVVAGYGGSDFITGIMKKSMLSKKDPEQSPMAPSV